MQSGLQIWIRKLMTYQCLGNLSIIASIMDCIATNACERGGDGVTKKQISETEQNKVEENLACAIKVQMKHLERSYSTLCCSVSDIWSFVTPPTCVYKKF